MSELMKEMCAAVSCPNECPWGRDSAAVCFTELACLPALNIVAGMNLGAELIKKDLRNSKKEVE